MGVGHVAKELTELLRLRVASPVTIALEVVHAPHARRARLMVTVVVGTDNVVRSIAWGTSRAKDGGWMSALLSGQGSLGLSLLRRHGLKKRLLEVVIVVVVIVVVASHELCASDAIGSLTVDIHGVAVRRRGRVIAGGEVVHVHSAVACGMTLPVVVIALLMLSLLLRVGIA